jgi:hypothetical protein
MVFTLSLDWLSSLVEKHVKVTSNPDVDVRASSSMRVPATARGVSHRSVDNPATDLPPMPEVDSFEYHNVPVKGKTPRIIVAGKKTY